MTFVFTDIEGSTRLFRQLGDELYPQILERHNALLRGVWHEYGGVEVNTEGDAFFVAFDSGRSAIKASVAAQQLMSEEAWPAGVALRIRIGIHSGIAYPRGDDYIALAVHQAARVVSAAHGGQTVASDDAIAQLEGDDLIEIDDLGLFRLRDFERPVRLHQISRPGVQREFPAVRALPADHHNIAVPLTPLIGRRLDLIKIAELQDLSQLTTLVGPGGVGKTRVAAEYGRDAALRWRDGAWMVRLEEIQDHSLIPAAISTAIGFAQQTTEPDELAQAMSDKHALLILDNCEHLIDDVAELVEFILGRCSELHVLATSREPLGIAGERLWRIQPLATARSERSHEGDRSESDAVRLFLDRASAVRPDLSVDDPETAAAIMRICDQLDGLPLAIELAARSLATRTLDQLASSLERSLTLRGRSRAASGRHRSLEAVLDWDYGLLSEDERAALCALGMFAASFDLDGGVSAIVALDLPETDALDLIWTLAEKSLITLDESLNATRYRMLRSVRAYARERLNERSAIRDVAGSLAEWYLRIVPPWMVRDRSWIARMDLEVSNIRGLIPDLAERSEERAQELACAIGAYHFALSNFAAASEELRVFHDQLPTATPASCALVGMLAHVAEKLGDADEAERWCDLADGIREEVGDAHWSGGWVPSVRALIALRRGDPERALQLASQARTEQLVGDAAARVANAQGLAAAELDRWDEAAGFFEEAQRRLEESNDLSAAATVMGNLAEIAFRRGDHDSAARYELESLSLRAELGDESGVALTLVLAARLAFRRADWVTATQLQARYESLLSDAGAVPYESDQRLSSDMKAELAGRLGGARFDAEFEDGLVLDVQRAIELARSILAVPEDSRPTP